MYLVMHDVVDNKVRNVDCDNPTDWVHDVHNLAVESNLDSLPTGVEPFPRKALRHKDAVPLDLSMIVVLTLIITIVSAVAGMTITA